MKWKNQATHVERVDSIQGTKQMELEATIKQQQIEISEARKKIVNSSQQLEDMRKGHKRLIEQISSTKA